MRRFVDLSIYLVMCFMGMGCFVAYVVCLAIIGVPMYIYMPVNLVVFLLTCIWLDAAEEMYLRKRGVNDSQNN